MFFTYLLLARGILPSHMMRVPGELTQLAEQKRMKRMGFEPEDSGNAPRRINVLGREFPMPRSRAARIAIGSVLVIGGCLGFLPILGFWMIPLGLVVLSYEFATVRRWRRRMEVWWAERRGRRRSKRK